MVLSATLRRRLLALVGASVVVVGMGPRSTSASPAAVSADDGELRDSAKQLEAAGEYEAAAASWAKVARVSLDPMALLYADSAWARAFADDGEPSHLCAALDLSSWLLDQPTVTADVRGDVLEIRESQLAAMPADLRCPEATRKVPLLVGRPPSPSATATSSSFPQPSKAPDEDGAARGTKNPAIRGGKAALAVGSLLGITSVIGGGITLQAVADLSAARDRHIAAGTEPSETERAEKEEVYGRGKTAEAVAIATGTAAAVALGVGAALLIRGRRRAQREATLVPVVGPQNAGIAIGGRF